MHILYVQCCPVKEFHNVHSIQMSITMLEYLSFLDNRKETRCDCALESSPSSEHVREEQFNL